MSGKDFLDTNIFVYAFDKTAPVKMKKAGAIIRGALEQGTGVISTQVMQEFLNVAVTKFETPLSVPDCKEYLATVLTPLCAVYPDEGLYRDAMDIRVSTGFSFYDSLIVAGAVRAGCKRLFSEDMQTGRTVMGTKIVNPFE